MLRATRTPSDPMKAEATATSAIATSATIPEVPMSTQSCTWSAKFCSTRSATRV